MKPAWKSKAIWINGLTSLLAIATMLAGSEVIAANPKAAAAVALVIAVVNIVIRFLTTQEITLT